MSREGYIASRLVGHTAGITSLLDTSDVLFFSGSNKWIIKKWNIEKHCIEMHIARHADAVTCFAVLRRK
jgi:hypothetical protein